MDELQKLISKLQTENKVLRAENKLLKTELIHVKATALRSEIYARRSNIQIHGVEAPKGTENLQNTVVTFLQSKLGITDADQLHMGTMYRISKKMTLSLNLQPFRISDVIHKNKKLLSRFLLALVTMTAQPL